MQWIGKQPTILELRLNVGVTPTACAQTTFLQARQEGRGGMRRGEMKREEERDEEGGEEG